MITVPIIELRSDTFTRPTPDMLAAMATAPLGDDVYGEDPTVRLLEEKASDAMGKPAACLMPSGTMANLAALTAHAPRGSRVLAGRDSDIYVYEAHGVSVCSGVALDPIAVDDLGRPRLADLAAALPEDWDDPQFSLPAVVCVENTANRAGGIPLGPPDLVDIAEFARDHRMAVHMDGARIFNAAVALRVPARELARYADSVQFCLSKGLSAPIGSVVAGQAGFINRVRRVRKMLGGGMRQAGVIAAAGIIALDTMVDRLAEDHAHARLLAEGLDQIDGISADPARVRTNIVMCKVDEPGPPHATLIALAAERGVRLAELGKGQLRAVTHREITRDDIDRAVHIIGAVVRDWRKEQAA
ncbi:threonine aldolase [Kibdelosporangium banguiense]|uniref:Threonine aldolase n=1 Tax=Kibdelosporangium banguiense TaxID=1365924 RepID=A0ABS4TVV3_9PSEU|nr:GntG family PLP-dependent aldolase [Kibdelosporangium banguiense]MBP2328540.1 threonine aldolase [Kibdelosporangium banguiense]